MIKVGRDSFVYQQLGCFFGFSPASYIYNRAALYPVQYVQQLSVFIISGANDVCQILSFEAHTEHVFFPETEALLYVLHYFGSGRGGQCQDRSIWYEIPDIRYFQISRTKVISPL